MPPVSVFTEQAGESATRKNSQAFLSSFSFDPSQHEKVPMAMLPISDSKVQTNTSPLIDPAIPPRDIVDESIRLFRPNMHFTHFPLERAQDRTLAYGIMFIAQCLAMLSEEMSMVEVKTTLASIGNETNFALPGSSSFPLVYPGASNQKQEEELREYMRKMRQAIVKRLPEVLTDEHSSKISKWWLSYGKRKFMNKSL